MKCSLLPQSPDSYMLAENAAEPTHIVLALIEVLVRLRSLFSWHTTTGIS